MTETASWPPEWQQPRRVRAVAMVIFFGLVGCGGVGAAISLFVPGAHDARAYLVVLLAPIAGALITIVVVTRLRVGDRQDTALYLGNVGATDELGLVIPYSRGLSTAYALLFAMLFLFSTAIAVVAIVALLAAGTDVRLWFMLIVFGGISASLGWALIQMLTMRLCRGAVVLTPSGVRHRWWTSETYQLWDETVSVSAGQMDGQLITLAAFTNKAPQFVRRRTGLSKQPGYELAPHTTIRGMYLALDPGLAYYTLRFYHENPAARAELGTGTAMQRVRNGGIFTGRP